MKVSFRCKLHDRMAGDGILVRCPVCGKDAVVRNNEENAWSLQCNHCALYRKRDLVERLYAARITCEKCGCHSFESVKNFWHKPPKQIEATCRYCGHRQLADVQDGGYTYYDPLEGLELYLQGWYRGHRVWAYNRRHLGELIAFIEAEDRPHARLPAFMKMAKNRKGLLRVLKRLQQLD